MLQNSAAGKLGSNHWLRFIFWVRRGASSFRGYPCLGRFRGKPKGKAARCCCPSPFDADSGSTLGAFPSGSRCKRSVFKLLATRRHERSLLRITEQIPLALGYLLLSSGLASKTAGFSPCLHIPTHVAYLNSHHSLKTLAVALKIRRTQIPF